MCDALGVLIPFVQVGCGIYGRRVLDFLHSILRRTSVRILVLLLNRTWNFYVKFYKFILHVFFLFLWLISLRSRNKRYR